MNAIEALGAAHDLYTRAPSEGKHPGSHDHFRSDEAIGLSLQDIRVSKGSEDLKGLLELGLEAAHGKMTLILIDHKPLEGKDGRLIYELAGQPAFGPRVGAELHIGYNDGDEILYINVTPSFKLMSSWNTASVTEELFERMVQRPMDVAAQEAAAMIALGAKALALPVK